MLVNAALRTLSGKNCIVNGDIGQSAVVNYSVQGPRVFVTNVADVYGGTTHADLTYASFDLFKDTGLEDAAQWAHLSEPDVLFNNAAFFDMGSVLEANLNQMDSLIDANVRAYFALLKALSQSILPPNPR